MDNLQSYPELNSWYQQNKASPKTKKDSLPTYTLWQLCQNLEQKREYVYHNFERIFNDFLENSFAPENDFTQLEKFANTLGLNLSQYIQQMGILAFEEKKTSSFLALLQNLNSFLKKTEIYFIEAWLHLNNENLAACISTCDKVATPFAPILTIKGQAQLESNHALNAIDSFKKALKIEPNDLMTWFQLAKASWICHFLDDAWASIQKCYDLDSENLEIIYFMGVIASHPQIETNRTVNAFEIIKKSVHCNPNNLDLVLVMLELAYKEDNKVWAQLAIEKSDWKKLHKELFSRKMLGAFLKKFGEHKWLDLSQKILQQIT